MCQGCEDYAEYLAAMDAYIEREIPKMVEHTERKIPEVLRRGPSTKQLAAQLPQKFADSISAIAYLCRSEMNAAQAKQEPFGTAFDGVLIERQAFAATVLAIIDAFKE